MFMKPQAFTLEQLYIVQSTVMFEEYTEVFGDNDKTWIEFIKTGRNLVTLYAILDAPTRILLQILICNVLATVKE